MKKSLFEFFIPIDDNFYSMHQREIQYFYNSKKQLIKSIELSFNPEAGEYSFDAANKKISTKQEECFYSDPNENGDWTKSYCLIPEQNPSHFVLRELEYYE